MNTPTHVLAGALVAQVAMAARDRCPGRWAGLASGVACFAVAVASHLLLDALPHDDWMAALPWFRGIPLHWLFCEALCTAPVLAVAWYAGRDHWVLLGSGLVGGMYPDIEKVAYANLHLPERYVLFRAHSLRFSSYDGGLPHRWVIAGELMLIVLFLLAILALSAWRRPRVTGRRSPVSRSARSVSVRR